MNDSRHPLTQRGRSVKRILLRPIGRTALRFAQGPGPVGLRSLIVRRAALPYFRARDQRFERQLDEGVFVGNTRDMLSLYVFAFGVWEPHVSAFVRGRLARGDVFVDVGANSGWYTLLASRCVGAEGAVLAVEPWIRNTERLELQISRNSLTNVRVITEAVSDHVGRVAVEPGPAEHTGLTRALAASLEPSSVRCRPLPDMIDSDEWSRIRLIKVDVEGAEFAVVRGLADRLSELPETAELVVEIGPERARDVSEVRDLFMTFQKAGYVGYALPNGYGVRDYVDHHQIDALPRVEVASMCSELNVVFSRIHQTELPVGQSCRAGSQSLGTTRSRK